MTITIGAWQARSEKQQQLVIEQLAAFNQASEGLERAILLVAIAGRDYLFSPAPPRLLVTQARIQEARASLKRLQEVPAAPEIARTVASLSGLLEDYLRQGEAVLGSDTPAGPIPAGLDALAAAREATLRQLDEVRAVQRSSFAAATAQLEQGREALYRRLLAALLLGLAALIVAGAWTVHATRTPILELLAGANAMEQGNLEPALRWNENIKPNSRAEVRRLARALGAAAVALQRRDSRVRADSRIAAAAAAHLVAEKIASEALAAIVEKMHAGLGVLYFSDTESAVLRPVATHAAGPDTCELQVGEGLAGQAASDRRLIVMRDIPRDAGFQVRLGHDQAPPRSVAAAPILFKDHVLGVVLVGALHNFDDYSLNFLESAAAQVAAGLQNSIAHARLRRLADDLDEQHQRVQAQAEELQAQNEELRTQHEELQLQEEEIRAQNDQLKALTDQLTLADTRKNDFLALLAHELRSPLGAISTANQLLSRPDLRPDLAEGARQVIARQTQQLARLMEDLLDTSRIVRGTLQVHTERLDLAALVRDCIADCRPALEQSDLKLEATLPDAPLMVRGDRGRLAQVVSNIFGNAVKFRREKGTVRVTLRPANGQAELRIADDGIGIDPAFMPRIFDPFERGDPRADGSGMGLGLALVKVLVESHGGSVTAHSAGRDQGAEFVVRLPLAEQLRS